ncbi:tail component [Vibrio phage VPMS1]|nr:tail component [Vibrio phage VPMS1]AFV51096.1 tail component [Vibrio phage VPMS1]
MSKAIQVPSDLKDEIAMKRFLDAMLQRIQSLEQQLVALENKPEQEQ